MITVKLQLYKHKTLANGNHPVVIQIIKGGKRSIVSLKYSATSDEWSPKSNRFIRSIRKVPNYEELNDNLDRFEMKAKKIVNEFVLQGETVTTQKVKRALFEEGSDCSIVGYMNEIIEDMYDANEVGNAMVYKNVRNSFKTFSSKTTQFSDITPRKLKKYKNWLRGREIKDSTIHLYIRTIRATFNKAIQDGEIDMNLYPFKNQMNPNGFSLSGIKPVPNHRALSPDELAKLMLFDKYKHPDLLQSYCLFIFMFLCRGLNWADLCLLKHKNIIDDRLVFNRKKTGKTFSIKISEPIRNIIGMFNCPNYIFPILNQRHQSEKQMKNRIKRCNKAINSDLKLIAMIVGINPSEFTTYCARHSYAMTLRRSGQGDEIISQALGHSDLATTKHYLESFENKVVDEADKVIAGITNF